MLVARCVMQQLEWEEMEMVEGKLKKAMDAEGFIWSSSSRTPSADALLWAAPAKGPWSGATCRRTTKLRSPSQ